MGEGNTRCIRRRVNVVERLRQYARPLARMGCFAIGTVYVLVGALALLALSGWLTGSADEDRMVYVLRDVAGGTIVIWTIVAGIAAYVMWRAIEMVADPYEFGSDARGIAQRAAVGLSASAYGVIAISAARIARGGGGNGEAAENEQQLLVARVLAWDGGAWLVGAAGVLVIAFGLVPFALVFRRAYATEIRIAPRSPRAQTIIHTLAWYGYSARGVILSVLG